MIIELNERQERNLFKRMTVTGFCWTIGRVKNYTRTNINGKLLLTHRLVFSWLTQTDLDDIEHLDHLCRNPACCNPDHLEAVTAQENALRGYGMGGKNSRKTHCPQGHPYDKTNTRIVTNGDRVCITCVRRHGLVSADKKAGRDPNWRNNKKCRNGHDIKTVGTVRRENSDYCKACAQARDKRNSDRRREKRARQA